MCAGAGYPDGCARTGYPDGCVQERDILACVKERDVLAGVQERDILTGTPPDWRYCQINSIIIDYREQSVLIEWVVWV